MTAQLAISGKFKPLGDRFRLPKRVPPFNTTTNRLFTAIWVAAILLAVFGPALALYQRYTSPGDNSLLVPGSRAGFAVSPDDATKVRFVVGSAAAKAGLRKGDDIIAIYGLPMPAKMPITEQALAAHAQDPAYVAMGNMLFGTDELPFPLTVRSLDGHVHDVTLTTSERYIDNASESIGVPPILLSFIDVVHVVFYPFLIWAAWILHRRNARDAVSSILSLAILLTIGTELPSSAYLATIGVPRQVLAGLYDLGNVLLVAGILLFPHGNLTRVVTGLVCAAPLLMVLHGQLYESYLLILLILAVLLQIRSLRSAEAQDVKQQIRWALFGFSGYAVFKALSYGADVLKFSTGSFAAQLGLELTAGLSFGLSMLVLQLGLLIALVRYRLYDAEAIISRTASAAILTLAIGGTFAAVMEGIITGIQFFYPESEASQELAAMAGAVIAAVFIEPMNRKTHHWVERHFHKKLLDIREKVPELMRDTRDSARLEEFLENVLAKVIAGVLSVRGAIILDGKVEKTTGVSHAEVERWFARHQPVHDKHVLDCIPEDHAFPLRLEIETSAKSLGWLLIGPRPDGSIPGEDEQEELEKIAQNLGRSINVVVSREEERNEIFRMLQTQNERIARIEQLLKLQS